jgi:hypothetical protein
VALLADNSSAAQLCEVSVFVDGEYPILNPVSPQCGRVFHLSAFAMADTFHRPLYK